MDPVSSSPPSGPALTPAPGRRSFLGWLTYGLGAVAAAVVGLPFIGYLFGARKAPVRWLSVGRVADFPQDQTRLVTFDNPISQPWDGLVSHTGVFVRYEGRDEREADETKAHTFLVLAVIVYCGIWLANTMSQMRKDQDCALIGRRNCAPIDVPAGR